MPFGLKNAPATFQRLMDTVLKGLQGNILFVYLDDIVLYANSIEEHEQKFNQLANRLRNANLKLQPSYAIGGVLSQGEVGKDRPIAFTSRALRGPELNYEVYEKEALAIIHSVEQFHSYTYNRKITIYTDHQPLVWFKTADLNTRVQKWRFKLSVYDYSVVYKKGKTNVNADSLSRNVPESPTDATVCTVTRSKANHPDEQNDEASCTEPSTQEQTIPKSNQKKKGRPPKHLQKPKPFIPPRDSTKRQTKQTQKFDPSIYQKQPEPDPKSFPIPPSDSENSVESDQESESENEQQNEPIDATSAQPSEKSYSTTNNKIVYSKGLMHCMDGNIAYFIDDQGQPVDEGARKLHEFNKLPKFSNISIGEVSFEVNKRVNHFALCIKEEKDISLSACKGNIKNTLFTLEAILKKREADIIFFTKSETIQGLPWSETIECISNAFQKSQIKIVISVPLRDISGISVADAFIKRFVSVFGTPKVILTDQGSNFVGSLMNRVAKRFKIKQVKTSPYHAQSNGSLERSHHVLKEFLKMYTTTDDDWDEWVDLAILNYNTCVQESTKLTPYELIFGRLASLPSALPLRENDLVPTYQGYLKELVSRLNSLQKMAYDNLLSSKLRSKKYYDQHTNEKNFKPGDYVFLLSGSTNKKKDQYSGPFKILEILNNHNMNLLSLKLFCLVSTAYCALYLNEKIDHSPGIYFEKEENIRYYNAQWDIVVFIDTDPLYHLMPHVHFALEQANATCKDPEMCKKTLHRMSYIENRIEHLQTHFGKILESLKNTEPRQPTDTLKSIKKRAVPLGFIGTASKFLFGTLSEEDGEKYDQQIRHLTAKQIELAKIAKDDAHLVHNRLNNIELRMRKERHDISEALKVLNETAKDLYYLRRDWYRWSYVTDLNYVLNEVESLLNLFADTLKDVLSIITYSKMDLVHPELVTPDQLMKIIRQIEDHHQNVEFPLPIDISRIEKLTHLAEISLGYKARKVSYSYDLNAKPNTNEINHVIAPLSEDLLTEDLEMSFNEIQRRYDQAIMESQSDSLHHYTTYSTIIGIWVLGIGCAVATYIIYNLTQQYRHEIFQLKKRTNDQVQDNAEGDQEHRSHPPIPERKNVGTRAFDQHQDEEEAS
ncbi:hypothetical protein TKK_0017010 [Trichogramma kaykai]